MYANNFIKKNMCDIVNVIGNLKSIPLMGRKIHTPSSFLKKWYLINAQYSIKNVYKRINWEYLITDIVKF